MRAITLLGQCGEAGSTESPPRRVTRPAGPSLPKARSSPPAQRALRDHLLRRTSRPSNWGIGVEAGPPGSIWPWLDSPNHELSGPPMPTVPPLGSTTMGELKISPQGIGADSRGKRSCILAEPARSSSRWRCCLWSRTGADGGVRKALVLHCIYYLTVLTPCIHDFVPFYLEGNFESMERTLT